MSSASFALGSTPALTEPRGARLFRRRRVLPTVLGAMLATALVTAAACTLASHLLINITPSMPLGVYWMSRRSPRSFGRRDLVAFAPPPSVQGLVRERRYLMEGAFLLKPIAAVAGDVVCIEGDALTLNGQPTAHLRATDSEGRPLPRDERCGALPSGFVYVLGSDPRSFDSRVFGPIGTHPLRSVTPLWTF